MKKNTPPFFNKLIKNLPCWGLLFILLVLSLVPLGIGPLTDARPMLLLMGVFYWALFRPNFLNIFILFLIGIFYDSFAATPFGLTSLILIATHVLIQSQRKLLLYQPFWILWGIFGILALLAVFIIWGLHMILSLGFVSPISYLMDVLLSVAFFPFIVTLLKVANPPLAQHYNKK